MKPRLKPIALAVRQVLQQWHIDRMWQIDREQEAKKREQEERERTEG